MNKIRLQKNDKFYEPSNCVKYLGVYLAQNLSFQEEVKHILRNMACGIKTLYSIREYLPELTRLLLLNALVISHLHYPSFLLNGISQNLITTLEKQLSWAVKACFNRTKFESSSDLKIKYRIFPVRLFLNLKALVYFWKWKNGFLPAFKEQNSIITGNYRTHKRTSTLIYNSHTNGSIMEASFFQKNSPTVEHLTEKINKNEVLHQYNQNQTERIFC